MKLLKWTFHDVGILAVSYIENSIKTYCFQKGYEYSIEKGSGFITKPMWVSITVPDSDVNEVKSDINYMF
jgi:hypothetical protein